MNQDQEFLLLSEYYFEKRRINHLYRTTNCLLSKKWFKEYYKEIENKLNPNELTPLTALSP